MAHAEQWRLSAAINKQINRIRKESYGPVKHFTFPGSTPITFLITYSSAAQLISQLFLYHGLPQGHCTSYLYSLKFLPPGTCPVPSGHISHCANVPLSETASLINPSKVESLRQHLHPFPISFYCSSLISIWYTFSSLLAQMVNNLPAMQQTQVRSLGWEGPLEKGMDTHSSILAWRIPMSEEPGGLQSIGLQAVGHDWSNLTHTHTHTHTQAYENRLFS